MNQETQTPNPKNEYEIGTSFTFGEPEPATGIDAARELVLGGLSRFAEQSRLEMRMFVYDALHRTNYRQIRHRIMAEERNRRFEESIGLERTSAQSR